MPDRPPFDPAPRPGEVAAIVTRGRRRKALRAAVPVSSAAVLAVVVALTAGSTSQSPQQLEFSGRMPDATSTAMPSTDPSPSPLDAAGPPQGPVPTASPVPPVVSPSPSPTRPVAQPSARPGQREPYRRQLGPRVEEYGYARCRQSQLDPGSRTVVHRGYCIEPTYRAPAATGTTDLAPSLRVCWQAESVNNGYLDYPTQEELDFVLFEAAGVGSAGAAPGRELYRFSDAVAYTQRPHRITVLQGDCLVWQGRLDFDRARYGTGEFLLRVETPTTTFDRAHQIHDVTFGA